MVSFLSFSLSSEIHLAKITMSTSCYARRKMNPYAANSCTSLMCWNEPVSDMGLSQAVPDFVGACQSKARVLPAFCWKCRTYLLIWGQVTLQLQYPDWPAGEVLQKEKGSTEASFWNTENPRTLPSPKYGVALKDVLEGLPCTLFQWHIVNVPLSSLKVSVNQREWMSISCALSCGKVWCNSSLTEIHAVVAEINTSVPKILLHSSCCRLLLHTEL